MKKLFLAIGFLIVSATILVFLPFKSEEATIAQPQESYWLLLHRKSNQEFLYHGIPGKRQESDLIKTFSVRSGVAGEKPTPLPQLLGREYWLIVKEEDSSENPETAPYFLTLDVPATGEPPYGPTPYLECAGEQCDWETIGYFGLHGTASQPEKLLAGAEGTSGCVRHSDEDITYLYNLLDPAKDKIRYYIEDI